MTRPNRRHVLAGLAAIAALPPLAPAQAPPGPELRIVPATGARVPCVGLGTWITFNVGGDPALLAECTAVMAAFFEGGGRMIDSSPMYGSSQQTVGHGLGALGRSEVFSADKVWTGDISEGPAQIEASRRAWTVPAFSLLQIHNLLGWEGHLPMLIERKAGGGLGHVGITTSHGRRHGEMARIMRGHDLDFVQLTYNLFDREAEETLLPLAADRGQAVIVNRPYQGGPLVDRLNRHPLPDWAAEIGARSWAQVALKFVLSHPAVTVAIPATTRVDHVRENLEAGAGSLPDAAFRRRIVAHVEAL